MRATCRDERSRTRGIASADIPKWALELTTQQYACSPFCNSGGSGGGGATPTRGGGGGGGGGNTPVAGIDIGGWTGTPTRAAQYQYASFAASAGTGSACPDPQNSRWLSPNGPDAWVSETAQQFNAFWFLRSLEYAQAYCGAPYNGDTAAQWGAEQANQLLQALAALPSHITPYLTATLADIEWEKVSPYSDGTPCPANSDNCSGPLNYGYWYRDPTHQSENVAVIDGFMNALCNAGYCENGAYTSTFNWSDITGFVAPSAIDGASFIQIASWDASAATIQSEEEQFTNQQYAIYSWQFNLTNPAGSGCVYPDLNLATAQTYADGAAPPIPRVDIWTISAVNVVC